MARARARLTQICDHSVRKRGRFAVGSVRRQNGRVLGAAPMKMDAVTLWSPGLTDVTPSPTVCLVAVGLVLFLLWWWHALRVVDTPTSCVMCKICYLRAAECPFTPFTHRWYRPHQVGEDWICDICIFTPLEATSPGLMARVLARGTSRLAHSSEVGWWLAAWLVVLTIPSRLVAGANVHSWALQRSDDKTSAVTSARTPPPTRQSVRRFSSPAPNKVIEFVK